MLKLNLHQFVENTGLDGKKPFHRCLLHIGTEKTGTTSIQQFLSLNREKLAGRGVFVPRSLAPHADLGILNHIFLTTYAMAPDRTEDEYRTDLRIVDSDGVLQHRREVITALAKEIKEEAKGCSTLLLSNEHLQSRLRTKEEVHEVYDLLRTFAEEVKVIVYLRSQHEVAISLFSTALQNGQFDIDLLPDFTRMSYVDINYFEYDKMIDLWVSVFGSSAVSVRLYGHSELIDNDLVTDFLTREQISLVGLEMLEQRSNVSLSAVHTRLLNCVNPLIAALPEDDRSAVRNKIINLLVSGLVINNDPADRVLPSRSSVVKFIAQFEDGNQRVLQSWFPGRENLFDVDISKYPEEGFSLSPSDEEIRRDLFLLLLNASK